MNLSKLLTLAFQFYPAIQSFQKSLKKPRDPMKVAMSFAILVNAAEDANIIGEEDEARLLALSTVFVGAFVNDDDKKDSGT